MPNGLNPGDCGTSSFGEALGLLLGLEETVTFLGGEPGFVFGITLIPPLEGLHTWHIYTMRFLSISSA